MDRRAFLARSSGAALAALTGDSIRASAATRDGAGLGRTRLVAARADSLLAMLDGNQRARMAFTFQRQPLATAAHFKGGMRGDVDMVGEAYGGAMWSNFPVSDVPRPGLRLGALDDAQRQAVDALLRALLSGKGYRKVRDIMGSDQALADGGTPYASGRDAYTLAIFGTPGDAKPWMVQFGGHHLALNIAMLGGRGVLAPVLTGCLPAIYTEGARTVRALAAENDLAFALLATLSDDQRRQAIIDHPVSALALGPGHDGETVAPRGLIAAAMDGRQRAMVFDLASEWAGILNDDHAAPRLREIGDGLADTRFAWSGPTDHETGRNGASYFRIHGPKLFIEFSPQEPGGDPTLHVHTIYRDPSNGYGRDFA